ncbi:MAG TPA: hypothetical protein VJB94_04675 [Candidatus Nanoarchaeia archaeon]|nr:hypothetical protein [Candidatus Nanoarchaeia archaeon]
MAKVEIVRSLLDEIKKKFKGESHNIIDLLETLEDNPHKGKIVGQVAGLLIKELRYKSFRFYFIVEGNKLRVFSREGLIDLFLRVVRMSDKRSQQRVIDEIKNILMKFGEEGF